MVMVGIVRNLVHISQRE